MGLWIVEVIDGFGDRCRLVGPFQSRVTADVWMKSLPKWDYRPTEVISTEAFALLLKDWAP